MKGWTQERRMGLWGNGGGKGVWGLEGGVRRNRADGSGGVVVGVKELNPRPTYYHCRYRYLPNSVYACIESFTDLMSLISGV